MTRTWTFVALAVALSVALMGCKCPMRAAGVSKAVVRVNCGSDKEYTDKAGNKWAADQMLEGQAKWGAVGGMTVTRAGLTFSGTDCPAVYLTERYQMPAYEFALPNGKYTVKLHFAETYEGITAKGERFFSVKVNGKEELKDFDPFGAAGGFAKPVVKTVKGVAVTDGKLKIEFVEQTQKAEINGIEIFAE